MGMVLVQGNPGCSTVRLVIRIVECKKDELEEMKSQSNQNVIVWSDCARIACGPFLLRLKEFRNT